MAQTDTLKVSDPPTAVPTDDIDLSAGIRRKPTAATGETDSIDLSAGIRQRGSKATGKSAPPESSSIWTGLTPPKPIEKALTFGLPIPKPEEYAKQADKARSEGRPWAASLLDLEGHASSFYKATADVASSLTSPGSMGLLALTAVGGEVEYAGYQMLAKLATLPGKVAGIGFGVQGLKIAATPQQPDENRYDAFWRRNLGLAAFLGTTHDTVTSAKGTFRWFLKRQFNLSDDLAGKVTDQVTKIDQVRNQTAAAVSTVDEATRVKIRALQDSLQAELQEIQKGSSTRVTGIRAQAEQAIEHSKAELSDLDKQRLRTGAGTVADTMQAFLQEHDRVTKPFDDIAEKIKGSVAKQDEVRGIIEQAFRDTGVDVAQIPPRALELFKSPEEGGPRASLITLRTPDGHYLQVDQQYAQSFVDKGYKLVGDVSPEGAITFDRITRIREDLSQAANAAKDTRVKAGLLKGYDDVTNLQEGIAEEHQLGPDYKRAKNNYRDFKRGIGSDMVHTFLDASDAEAQALGPKLAEMTTKQNAEAMRTVLKAAGVDVGPLDAVIKNIDLVDKEIAETKRLAGTMVSETRKSAASAATGAKREFTADVQKERQTRAEQTKAATSEGEKAIGEVKAEPVIPGKDVEALRGMGQQELMAMRIRHQMGNAHTTGFVNTWAMSSIVYGLIKTAEGSAYGPPLVAIGTMRIELPRLMRNRQFQDWIIRQSGMDPASVVGKRARRGLAALEPMIRKALKTGVPQAAAAKGAQQLSVPEVPQ